MIHIVTQNQYIQDFNNRLSAISVLPLVCVCVCGGGGGAGLIFMF